VSWPPPGAAREEDLMNLNDPPERPDSENAWKPSESERLYRRHMQEVLGVNAAGVDMILRLRNQVIALQTRLRQLEVEISIWEAGQHTRLTRHRETCFEASWQEVPGPEERR
jgi:hypothetical protein